MKSVYLFFLIVFFAVSGTAQEICRLETAPAVFGLRLGMTPEQVQNAFGREPKIKIKKDGEHTFFQNYIEKPAPPSLNGVRALYLRFFDRRLYQIEIFYEERQAIKTPEQFAASLSAQLNFPANFWQYKINRIVTDCGNFTLVADRVLNPRIELTDETIRAKVEASREQKEN